MSAVSIGGDVLHLLTFLAMGFASAGQVIISQYVGARKHHLISKMIGTMFTFLFAISIIMSVSCYLLRYQILNILNTPSESYTYTMDYMVICIFGLIFIYGYNIVSAILRGMGDSQKTVCIYRNCSGHKYRTGYFFRCILPYGGSRSSACHCNWTGSQFRDLYILSVQEERGIWL